MKDKIYITVACHYKSNGEVHRKPVNLKYRSSGGYVNSANASAAINSTFPKNLYAKSGVWGEVWEVPFFQTPLSQPTLVYSTK